MHNSVENDDSPDTTYSDDDTLIITSGGKWQHAIEETHVSPVKASHSERGMISLPNGHKRYMEPIR